MVPAPCRKTPAGWGDRPVGLSSVPKRTAFEMPRVRGSIARGPGDPLLPHQVGGSASADFRSRGLTLPPAVYQQNSIQAVGRPGWKRWETRPNLRTGQGLPRDHLRIGHGR